MGQTITPQIDAQSLTRMRERTRLAREQEAGLVFAAGKIDEVLSAAAKLGLSAVIFAPSSPMDLSETATAATVKTMFEKAGFLAEWQTIRPTADSEPHTVLRVSWGADARPRE